MDAVVAFSPGEYFKSEGKSKTFVQDAARSITIPAFITSAKAEKKAWKSIFDSIPGQSKTSFVPTTSGNHGSRALWDKHSDSEQYWGALKTFLKTLP